MSSYPSNQRAETKRLRFKAVSLLAPSLEDSGISYDEEVRADELRTISTAISTFFPETLRLITESNMSPAARTRLAGVVYYGWTEAETTDYIHLTRFLGEEMAFESGIALGHIRAFEHYAGLIAHTIGEPYSAERAGQIAAIFRVTSHLQRNGVNVWQKHVEANADRSYLFIHDSKLSGLVLNSGLNREAVVRVITERNIIDADEIMSIIESTTPLLSVGSL